MSSFLGTLLSTPVDTSVFMYVCMTLTKRRDDTVVAEVHMVDDMEVDKVADMVSVIVSDMVANMVADIVAHMEVVPR